MNKQQHKINLLSLILALCLIFGTLPQTFAEALSGDGTSSSPYLIATADDLKQFRDMVNGEDSSALCAKLTADIDLADDAWTPFSSKSGYVTTAYAGTFDGDFHTIKGLSVAGSSNLGLFSAICGGTIKNLNVIGSVSATGNYIGGICGKIQYGTISNCSFSGSVSSTNAKANIGGICGYAGNSATQKGAMSGCVNYASVSGSVSGGICGYAKFSSITDCYNTGAITGKSRSGGIAGQLQNNCTAENCYNTGSAAGSATAADICDFLYTSASLKNCYYTAKANGAGAGSVDGCGEITTAEELLTKLGSSYKANPDGGYPILFWQGESSEPEKNPQLKINGATKIYMTNTSAPAAVTLSCEYIDMDSAPQIAWSVTKGSELVTLEVPEGSENNAQVIVTAIAPGTAEITAKGGEYSAKLTLSILPFITTVEIGGNISVGETVSANVFTLGGKEYDYDNFPALEYAWKYLTAEDYLAGNTGFGSYKTIAGANARTFTIPADLEGCYLSFDVKTGSDTKFPSHPEKIYSKDEGILRADRSELTIDTSDIKEETTITLPESGSRGSKITWQSSNDEVIDAKTGAVTLPEEGIAEVTLTANLEYAASTATKTFTIKVYSKKQQEEDAANKLLYLQNEVSKLGDIKMYPKFGTDTNVVTMLKTALANDSISASLISAEEVYGGAGISENGDITYFYADPDNMPAVHFASYNATFELSYEGAKLQISVPVIIYWDRDKVKSLMSDELLSKISLDSETQEDLSLPKVIDSKRWGLISWTSSNENIISVSSKNQQTADTLFDPYVGVVRRGAEDEKVILTATCTFGYANDVTGSEAPITASRVFEVTVKAIDAEDAANIKAELSNKLDAGFEKAGLCDSVTGERLIEKDGAYTAANDILLPKTSDFGVDGKYYPVSITSTDEDVIIAPDTNNAARVQVIRPAVGKGDAEVQLIVSISDKDTAISASRVFDIRVSALTQEEIDSELALMEKVKASYWDGIKGENTDSGNITKNLSPFCEVYSEDGELVWVRSNDDVKNHGIIPTAINGWYELQAYRLFKSSNPAAITHENLLVTMQKNAKSVTVESALSSETLGIYGELYQSDPEKYADYAALAPLYYQPVSADLVVRGTSTPSGEAPSATVDTVSVTFILNGSDGVLIRNTRYSDLDETATVFDIFTKALAENGFTYDAIGSYVTGITDANGKSLAAFDYGPNSGWMYRVNNILPDVAMSGYGIKNGDKINVFYTKDYTTEPGVIHGSSGSMSSGKSDSNQSATPSPSPSAEPKPSDSTPKFADINGHWAADAINYVNGKGLMKGTSDTEFEPDSALTRAMFVTILYRMDGEPEAGSANFKDVPDGSWYAKAVAWANANGITSGIDEDTFAPDLNITREQLAALLYRYAAYKGYDTEKTADISGYSDRESISEYAETALGWAAAAGIITGRSESTINPADNTTRAEAASVLMRIETNLK